MPFWWKPYEPLLEAKAVDGPEAIRDLIAKELVELFEQFPPPAGFDFEDAALAKKVEGRTLPRVSVELGLLVLDLAKLDVQHEIEAIDHLFRNDGHRNAAPTDDHVAALHVLWRGIVEHLYARKEEATGILKTKDLVAIVDKARARWLKIAPS